MLSESSSTIARCDGTTSRSDETHTGSSSIAATASRTSPRKLTSRTRLPRDRSRPSQR